MQGMPENASCVFFVCICIFVPGKFAFFFFFLHFSVLNATSGFTTQKFHQFHIFSSHFGAASAEICFLYAKEQIFIEEKEANLRLFSFICVYLRFFNFFEVRMRFPACTVLCN